MDPIKNPISPGTGSPQPELVGRDSIFEFFRVRFFTENFCTHYPKLMVRIRLMCPYF